MSQVNMVSIDLAPASDVIGAKSNSSFGDSSQSSGVSDVMTQHQQSESGNNLRAYGKQTSATEQVNQAKSRINKENAQEKPHGADDTSLDKSKEGDVDMPDEHMTDEVSASINEELDGIVEQGEALGKSEDLSAEDLLALLTASDNTVTSSKIINGEMAYHKLLAENGEVGNVVYGKPDTKGADALANHILISSNSALEKSAKVVTGAETADSEAIKESVLELPSLEAEELALNNKAVKSIEGASEVDETAVKIKSELQVEHKTEPKLIVVDAKETKSELNDSSEGELSAGKALLIDENTDIEDSLQPKKINIVDPIAHEKITKDLLDKNQQQQPIDELSKASVEFSAVKTPLQTVVVNEQGSDGAKQTQGSNMGSQINSATLQQSMSQDTDPQASDQEASDKPNEQPSVLEEKAQLANSAKAEVLKDTLLSANNGEKSLERIHTTASAEETTIKAVTSSQEQALQQLLSKNSSDGITQQTLKNEVKLEDEALAINRKDFTNAVKEKVMVMINQKINQLEIRLDPAELGSMHVKLNLQNEQAAVSFIVQNSQAKEALEQNMHKLKDMLSESGVDVGESSIEQQDQSAGEQGESSKDRSEANNGGLNSKGEEEIVQSRANLYKASATGVDYYA